MQNKTHDKNANGVLGEILVFYKRGRVMKKIEKHCPRVYHPMKVV